MNQSTRLGVSVLALLCLAIPALSQSEKPKTAEPVKLPPPPDRNEVAVVVNGQTVPEIAVYRALMRVSPEKHAQFRGEVLSFLVEKTLIDQYLDRLKVNVDPKDVVEKIAQLKEEVEKEKKDFNEFLASLHLTEAELKSEIEGALRWDKFTDMQAPEKVLKEMFGKNRSMFDGSLVRARHILIKPEAKTTEAAKKAQAKAVLLKKEIEGAVAQELAKLPASADNLQREAARVKALEMAFIETAKKVSDCPSKEQGGELGWFPRLGKMVEPFAAAAFSLKPYEMSDPVASEFGFHLILTIDQKPGRDVKFEQVRSFVKEVYAERLREAVLQRMRPISKVEVKKGS